MSFSFLSTAGSALWEPVTFRQLFAVAYHSVLFKISQSKAQVLNKSFCPKLFSSSSFSTVYYHSPILSLKLVYRILMMHLWLVFTSLTIVARMCELLLLQF